MPPLNLTGDCICKFLLPGTLLIWLSHLYFLLGYWPISVLLNWYKWQIFTMYKSIIPQQTMIRHCNNWVRLFWAKACLCVCNVESWSRCCLYCPLCFPDIIAFFVYLRGQLVACFVFCCLVLQTNMKTLIGLTNNRSTYVGPQEILRISKWFLWRPSLIWMDTFN